MRSPPVIAAVVVCFHPERGALEALVRTLALDCNPVVVVNNSPKVSLAFLEQLPRVHVLSPNMNLGVAAAINLANSVALDKGCDAVIHFDQDSTPVAGLASRLWARYESESAEAALPSRPIGALGPMLQDRRDGCWLSIYAPYNWGRRPLTPQADTVFDVDHMVTSGCLIPAQVLRQVGPMNEGLFIDAVDMEWCARARAAGLRLIIDGHERMAHAIGEEPTWFMGRRLHLHKPFRIYYMLRNALLVARDRSLPLGWRLTNLVCALRVGVVTLIVGRQRLDRAAYLCRGLWHGLTGRAGALSRH